MDQPGKVANPAHGQLKRENEYSPVDSARTYVPESLLSRDGFGRPIPCQPAHLHTQTEYGAYLRDFSRVPRRRPFIHLYMLCWRNLLKVQDQIWLELSLLLIFSLFSQETLFVPFFRRVIADHHYYTFASRSSRGATNETEGMAVVNLNLSCWDWNSCRFIPVRTVLRYYNVRPFPGIFGIFLLALEILFADALVVF